MCVTRPDSSGAIISGAKERSSMTTSEMDQARSEAFAERMIDVLNDGALALMTSIGHRTGLFDAMAGLPPSTSEGIATASGLNERDVPEWPGAVDRESG